MDDDYIHMSAFNFLLLLLAMRLLVFNVVCLHVCLYVYLLAMLSCIFVCMWICMYVCLFILVISAFTVKLIFKLQALFCFCFDVLRKPFQNLGR